MSKFLSGRLRRLLVGITGYTENDTVVQTTGKVGIGTTNAQQHSLFVVGSTNITGDTIVGGELTTVGVATFQSDVFVDESLYVGGLEIIGGASVGEDINARNLNLTGIATVAGLTDLDGDFNVAGVSTFQDTAIFDSTNSIQIPSGTEAEKDPVGVAVTGQIRFNTTNQQFEGFGVGNNWGSLGGVKDVDGDTEIKAELSAGSDEDALFFYTGGNLSGILSTTSADFNVDVNIDSNFNVTGVSTFQDQVNINSDTGNTSDLIFNGDTSSTNTALAKIVSNWDGTPVSDITFYSRLDAVNKDDGYIKIRTAESNGTLVDRLTIGVNGMVGVGPDASVPAFTLDVREEGSQVARFENTTSGSAIVRVTGSSGADLQLGNSSNPTHQRILANPTSKNIKFYADNGERFQVAGYGVTVFGTTFSEQLSVSGVSTFQNNVHLLDDDRLQIGGSVGTVDGLEIYHDGSNSYIADTGTGAIQVSASAIIVRSNVGENMAQLYSNGGVNLFYNNSRKFETTNIGIAVSNGTSDTATIAGPTNLIIDPTVVGDNTGLVRIKGDLYVDGTEFIVNSTTIELTDLKIGIATNVGTNLLLDGGGIGIGSDNIEKTILWNNSNSRMEFNADLYAPNFTTGNLNASTLNINGISTFGGQITAGGTTGTSGQYLESTGIGVTWASFPTLRTTQTTSATNGQTTFNFTYNVNFLDVFVNGVKLTSSEYTATNGTSVVLATPAFENDIVELQSYNIVSTGADEFISKSTLQTVTAASTDFADFQTRIAAL